MSMQTATIPNLAATEKGFLLDTGESVAVSVVAQPLGPTDTTVTVLIGARVVDPATGATVKVGQSDAQASAEAYSVLASTLANGADLNAIVASGMDTMAQKARSMKAALSSLAALGG